MATDIGPVAEIHFQFLIGHPWIEAALIGAIIGIAGASLFIGASSLVRAISEGRRSRRTLALIVRTGEAQPPTELKSYLPPDLKKIEPKATIPEVHPRPTR